MSDGRRRVAPVSDGPGEDLPVEPHPLFGRAPPKDCSSELVVGDLPVVVVEPLEEVGTRDPAVGGGPEPAVEFPTRYARVALR